MLLLALDLDKESTALDAASLEVSVKGGPGWHVSVPVAGSPGEESAALDADSR